MSIATVVTRGYGSFGTIPFVVTRGYSISLSPWTEQGEDSTSWSDQTADATSWSEQSEGSDIWTEQ